jgi:signal transduction histidine kinase
VTNSSKPGHRTLSRASRGHEGTGIGLAIVRKLVQHSAMKDLLKTIHAENP